MGHFVGGGFARGGVSILAATGVVDTLAFGSECGNAAKLQRAAKALLRADFPDALREELAKGLSFAAARESAARALIGEDAAVLREPNDILGVEYCKALLQSGSTIAPLAILRKVGGTTGVRRRASPRRATSASCSRTERTPPRI